MCVETDFASRLWHQDFKWLDSTRVQFKAGLSGDLWIFEYDLATQQLTFAGNKHVKLRTSELNAPGAKY